MDISFLQSIVYMAALFGFVWTMRKDSKDDYLRLEKKLEVWREETNSKIDAIAKEMTDFHGRLCEIEGRRKSKE